jgi:hypothetical protein
MNSQQKQNNVSFLKTIETSTNPLTRGNFLIIYKSMNLVVTRIFAVIYALITMAAPGLIVCRHSDGRTMVELSAFRCCAEQKMTPSCCCSAQSPIETPTITSSFDSCVDSPVQVSKAMLSQSTSHIDLALSLMCIDLSFVAINNYETQTPEHTDFHDPPPSTILASLSTIIILC